jgi:hypothetical protein
VVNNTAIGINLENLMWNHRVWRTTYNEEVCYEVKETYYNASGQICGCTEEAYKVYGYSFIEMKETLARITKLLENTEESDILDTEGFIFAEWG